MDEIAISLTVTADSIKSSHNNQLVGTGLIVKKIWMI
jgi:hypothetical protein